MRSLSSTLNRRTSAQLVAVLVAVTVLAFSAVASAVSPHRPRSVVLDPTFGTVNGGTTVTFTGTNFQPPMTVRFGSNLATGCTTPSAGSFTCVTPSSSVLGLVTVTVKNHKKGNSGTLIIPNGFTYTCDGCTVSPVSALFEGVAPAGNTEPNGIIEPGETTKSFTPTWLNTSASAFTSNSFTGSLSSPVLPAGTLTTAGSPAQYPDLASGAAGACTSCYTLGASFTTTRPSVHVDATVLETPSVNAANAHTWTIHIGNSFPDVPSSNLLYTHVERLVHNSVTLGNLDGTFGPTGSTTRSQIAAFISRSAAGGDANVPSSGTISSSENPVVNGAYNCTTGGTSLFNDVLPTDGFCRYIHYIAKMNTTSGCDAHVPKPNFCKTTTVTRSSMAFFIARAEVTPDGDALIPDANTGTGAFASRSYDCVNGPAPFLDVPLGTTNGCKQIGFIWTLGVIDGDGAGHFAPTTLVNRAQMAKFLVNAFNLTINNP
jgi:IPT/TIG domain-containing protein/S-layer family protein